MPTRIQRKRTKDWKMPKNTVYVGRPSIYGNPYILHKEATNQERWGSVLSYLDYLGNRMKKDADFKAEILKLRGKNLACFCPIGVPCHADSLLKIVNRNND